MSLREYRADFVAHFEKRDILTDSFHYTASIWPSQLELFFITR
jgi:hypothetical protein